MQIRLSDGRTVNLPDGMSQEEIEAALKKLPPAGPVEFDAGRMAGNVGSSAKQYGKDMLDAALSPIDTAKNMIGLGRSAINKAGMSAAEAITGKEAPSNMPGRDTRAAEAVGEFYKDRYGGMDEFKTTLMDDPVGVLADASSVLTGGAGLAARVPGLAKAAKVAQTAGRVMEPLNLATSPFRGGARALARVMPESTARNWYQSAAKFPPSMAKEKRDMITNTLLDEGILPNEKGAKILAGRLEDLNKQLDDLVTGADEAGKVIPVGKVFQHIEKLKRDKSGFKAEGKRDLARIDQVIMDALDSLDGRTTVTPGELQAFKVDLYDKIYQRKMSSSGVKRKGIKTEAQSTVARGAKDALSDAVPGAKDVNRQLSGLYQARVPLERAVNKLENANKVSIRGPLNVAGGVTAGGVTGNPVLGAIVGVGAYLVDNPQVKGRLARAIVEAKKGNVGNVEKIMQGSTEIRLALALADRSEEELAEIFGE